jgi:hypothetical protein
MMKKFRNALFIGLILMQSGLVKAQIVDNYGIKFGTGLSNQYWYYKNLMFSNLSGWHENKIGFVGQVYAECFVDDITLITGEGEPISIEDNRVVFHNLSLDLSLKIIPIKKSLKPYILLGLRGDYLMGYRSVIVDFQGSDHQLNTGLYNDFNKFTYSGLIGFGITYIDLMFLEFEYNPAISKNFESNGLAVHDKYFTLTAGLNINKLIKKKTE